MLEGVILNVCCVCYVMLCNFFRNSCPSELKKKIVNFAKNNLKIFYAHFSQEQRLHE